MKRQRLWWALTAAFLVGLPCGAHSASITVDGTNCTLAEAITSANNNNAAGNGCVDGSGADTITLQVDVTLAADLPQITSTITIQGGGHFISGNNARRVLYVASSGNLTLNNTTVKDGRVSSDSSSFGGGIYNYGTVTMTNSTVSGNTVSTLSDSYGGGIYNGFSGMLTLTHSTVSGNTVSTPSDSFSSGGGIYNIGGTVTLTNSTVSGNTAYSDFSSAGGGIANHMGTLMLTNSTVSDNTVSCSSSPPPFSVSSCGGIYDDQGMIVVIIDSTVSGNTVSCSTYSSCGGIGISSNTFTLRSSLISGNTATIGKEVCKDGSSVTTASSNVFGHSGETSAQAFVGFTPGASDVTATSNGTTPTALAAILSPLANNGGPTKTHTLPAGSPAINIDASCAAGQSTDQRGYSRPIGAGCDAGAFEAFVLRARTWLMTAPPCTPVPLGIGSQYGSDIPGGTYGTNWISYRWDAAAQSYGSAQAATDALVQGTGNWLYSTVPATLTVTGTATPTVPCSNYGSGLSGNCFAINLTPSSTARWQMLGHPFPYNVSWADVRVATYNGSAWTQRTPTQAAAASIMAKEMWRWSGSTYETKDDATVGLTGTLLPQEAVWVRMLTGSSAFSSGNIKLLVPAR